MHYNSCGTVIYIALCRTFISYLDYDPCNMMGLLPGSKVWRNIASLWLALAVLPADIFVSIRFLSVQFVQKSFEIVLDSSPIDLDFG